MLTSKIEKSAPKILNVVKFLQKKLDNLEINSEQVAHQIVKLIPSQCPFAREIYLFDRVLFRIPALCKFNPFYEQLVALRFHALCFLAEQCDEDISIYCT